MFKHGLEWSLIFAFGMEMPNHQLSGTIQDQILHFISMYLLKEELSDRDSGQPFASEGVP